MYLDLSLWQRKNCSPSPNIYLSLYKYDIITYKAQRMVYPDPNLNIQPLYKIIFYVFKILLSFFQLTCKRKLKINLWCELNDNFHTVPYKWLTNTLWYLITYSTYIPASSFLERVWLSLPYHSSLSHLPWCPFSQKDANTAITLLSGTAHAFSI